jgi:hypothetical protein
LDDLAFPNFGWLLRQQIHCIENSSMMSQIRLQPVLSSIERTDDVLRFCALYY